MASKTQFDRQRLKALLAKEERKFIESHGNSLKLFERAKKSLLAGVPMSWMIRWAGNFPVFVKDGKGQYFNDVDGHKYLDLCLGDTGAMTGHAPSESMQPIIDRLQKGVTFMLPTEDALTVGEELQKRFGLPYWQIAMTATDANRFVLRLARQITKRHYIAVFNWCYHGTVDETFVVLDEKTGKAKKRPGNIGSQCDPATTTKVVEFNNLEALEEMLKNRDVACLLAEPAMTNIGIIHPEPGYWEKARAICKKYGTLLIMDETHTICAGPGGFTRAYDISPDIFVIGKPIASGIPAAAYGFSEEMAQLIQSSTDKDTIDTSGIGGTLSGNALALTAIKATLTTILTAEHYKKTIALAARFTEGVQRVIDEKNLPWSITQLGNRAEYWFKEKRPKNGGEAAAASDLDLDRYMHLYALNRGILMTPFHNMALIAPTTTEADIDYHTKVFRDAVEELLSGKAKL
jgi:glutamate-1-semialdehyde 2,1-aminomutase